MIWMMWCICGFLTNNYSRWSSLKYGKNGIFFFLVKSLRKTMNLRKYCEKILSIAGKKIKRF